MTRVHSFIKVHETPNSYLSDGDKLREYLEERYRDPYDRYYDPKRSSAGIPSIAEPFIPPPVTQVGSDQ